MAEDRRKSPAGCKKSQFGHPKPSVEGASQKLSVGAYWESSVEGASEVACRERIRNCPSRACRKSSAEGASEVVRRRRISEIAL